jgi:MFS family permease
MTSTVSRGEPPQSPGGLSGRGFLLVLAATFCAFANYAPLLSVVPLWADEGGADAAGTGAATGVTMATTVAAQLCMPWLLRRWSLAEVFAVGALLLGVPTLAYLLSSQLVPVLAVSAVRGAGFGVVAVAGSALVADLVAEGKRGQAVGWHGIAAGLPQVVCLPLAVWGVDQWGYGPVFTATALLSIAAAPLIWPVRRHGPPAHAAAAPRSAPQPGSPQPEFTGRWRPLLNPWTLLITAACALGGLTSFLPLALENGDVAAAALFVLSATMITGRWAAGWLSDRFGTGRLLVPSVLACATGMAGFAAAVAGAPVWPVSLLAATVYGLGFGALQNDTLVVMFARTGPGGSALASTVWNSAYDAGTGIGSVSIGLLAGALTMGGAFTVTAVAIAAAAPLAWTCARRSR